jgi:hypothetical protein
MSEAVEILIKADDQASAKLAEVGSNASKSGQQAERLMRSLETSSEKYKRQLAELAQYQADGAITAEQFANAEDALLSKLADLETNSANAVSGVSRLSDAQDKVAVSAKKAGDALKDSGNNVKASSDLFATLAGITGNSELAGLANAIGGVAEKAGQFSEVSKAGAGGAMAFKLGLMGLAASAGFAVGKVLGDIIWQTEKFERAMAQAKETAAELDAQLKKNAATLAANVREDIELIRDPEEKRAAYAKLLGDLSRDIQTASDVAGKSAREAEEWADAWQITGNRKQYAIDAKEQATADKERLAGLKDQRDELMKIVGARAQENAAIKEANAAKDKSESYLETLRQEVEYMKATREEQIKIDALRNTTDEDRGEAERLLKERDAIKAKQDAEREAAAEQKKMQEDAIRATEKAAEDAERARQKAQEDREKEAEQIAENARREVERVEDIIAAERERLELQKIEKEQGKEAATAKRFVNQGVDEATAKQLAAEQAAFDKAKQDEADAKAKEDAKLKDAKLKGEKTADKKTDTGPAPSLAAMESRMLTRGPVDTQSHWMEDAAKSLRQIMASSHITAAAADLTNEKLGFIDENTSSTTQVVAVT